MYSMNCVTIKHLCPNWERYDWSIFVGCYFRWFFIQWLSVPCNELGMVNSFRYLGQILSAQDVTSQHCIRIWAKHASQKWAMPSSHLVREGAMSIPNITQLESREIWLIHFCQLFKMVFHKVMLWQNEYPSIAATPSVAATTPFIGNHDGNCKSYIWTTFASNFMQKHCLTNGAMVSLPYYCSYSFKTNSSITRMTSRKWVSFSLARFCPNPLFFHNLLLICHTLDLCFNP
jgi:hypothetical protein